MLVTDRAGAFHVLEYEMLQGDQGWRIDGVRLLQEGAAGRDPRGVGGMVNRALTPSC